jgi:protein-S-isoprenylcysteine O-methyltransferase Ste14
LGFILIDLAIGDFRVYYRIARELVVVLAFTLKKDSEKNKNPLIGTEMTKSDFFLLLGLFLTGLAIRNVYELLKMAQRIQADNKVAFAVVFVAMSVLWVSWFSLCPLDLYPLSLPAVVRWTGLFMVIVGLGLAIAALLQLKGLENIKQLVTTGLYSRLRHPMYLGFILWILGWSTYHGAAISLLLGFLGIGSILYWRRLEDHGLVSRHGEAYRSYRAKSWF